MESDNIAWMNKTTTTQSGCTTGLKSNVNIIDSEGNEIKPLKQRGQFIWDYIPPNSSIQYEIETMAQNSGNQGDRVNISLIGLNVSYLKDMADRIYLQGTPEEKREYLQDPSKVSEIVFERMDSERMTLRVMNQTVNTNNDGIAYGIIPISGSIRGPIAITIAYGYSVTSEAYGWDKFWESVAPKLAMAVIDVVLFVAGFLTGGATWYVRGALLAAEVAHAMAEMGMAGAEASAGEIGENKYGCGLGNGHFHSYGGVITTMKPDSENILVGKLGWGIASIGLALVTILLIPSLLGGDGNDSQ